MTIALLTLAATRRRAALPPSLPSTLDATRSIAVTDLPILEAGFPFRRVVDTIVAGSPITGEQLIRQMYDTQNPRPGMADNAGPHCHFVAQSVGSQLIFPGSSEGDQVSGFRTAGDGGSDSRWETSPAMDRIFVPNRVRILREFLANGKPPEHSN